MFLINYSKRVVKSKLFLPVNFIKPSNLNAKEISNEPLQKSKPVTESSFNNKADNVRPEEDSFTVGSKKEAEKVRLYDNTSEESKSKAVAQDVTEQVVPAPTDTSLVQRKDVAELLLNADPFEEVPGPKVLKKIANLWKYLPEIGCQATVSAMLSIFNVGQKITEVTKLGKVEARPFDRLFRKYGPIVKLQGPLGADIVIINKPEHVAKVYDQEGKHPVRSTLDSVEKCRALFRKSCGGPFNLSGNEWEDLRKALNNPLTRGGERYFAAIEDTSEVFVKRMRTLRNRQNEVPVDFMVEVTRWSMECLCHVILGKSLGFHHSNVNSASEPVRLLKALIDATQNICRCESGFQLWRFMNTPSSIGLTQACEVIDGFLSKHIRLAQVNLSKNKDELLGKDKTEVDVPFIENLLLNECLSPDEVLTCLVDLLILGVNTTSSALAFTLYFLAQNHKAQRTLFKEILKVLPEKQSRLEFDQLNNLKYLDACIKEGLRLRMPMPTMTRVLPADIALSNFRIPKGTYMVMDIQSACLREQNFEKADKFIPERWSESSNVQPFSFIPFGHGARSCLGKHLAEVQLKSCIAKMIRNYQLEYNYGDIQGTKTVISFPSAPLRLSFSEREA
ncbi:hypothetical protein RUM43_012952 [Polyplax serrata]|uniref:Cytochrome P450 n=1 Tax=Polyplax serrata TaxID=468196 RepID=A0AAN8RSH4_POLSC